MRVRRGELPLPDPTLHLVGIAGTERPERGLQQLALVEYFGLRPSSKVLEIGCGLGRLARQLASVLDLDGSYTGFDIAPKAIEWLNQTYAPLLSGFRFDLLDVENPKFHPGGRIGSDQVRFPYEDSTFDFVCAFEVFMHLALDGLQNYMHEVARVLKPGGRALLTFNAVWERETEPVFDGRAFVDIGGGVHTRFPESHGIAMAYKVDLIRQLFTTAGMEIVAEIEGLWHSPFADRPPDQPRHNCDVFVGRRRD